MAQKLGREKAGLEKIVETLDAVSSSVVGCVEMLEFAAEEQDQELVDSMH